MACARIFRANTRPVPVMRRIQRRMPRAALGQRPEFRSSERAAAVGAGRRNRLIDVGHGASCRTGRRVDGGTRPILARSLGQAKVPRLDQQVVIRWRRVDLPGAERIAVLRMNCSQNWFSSEGSSLLWDPT